MDIQIALGRPQHDGYVSNNNALEDLDVFFICLVVDNLLFDIHEKRGGISQIGMTCFIGIHCSHASVFFDNTRIRNIDLIKCITTSGLFCLEVDVAFIDDPLKTIFNKLVKGLNLMR